VAKLTPMRAGGNPGVFKIHWTPAFAGVTFYTYRNYFDGALGSVALVLVWLVARVKPAQQRSV
jgi:hypothetical protein